MLSLFSTQHTATPNIYPLSLHDALPISYANADFNTDANSNGDTYADTYAYADFNTDAHAADDSAIQLALIRSEEHTSELQSHSDLVCRLLLEKKKQVIRFPQHKSAASGL